MKSSASENCLLYIASPLGFSEVGRDFYYNQFLPLIKRHGFPVSDPWKTAPQDELRRVLALPYGEAKRQRWANLNKVIGKRNEKAIREARGIVAVLDGTDVDSGTASEIGFGYALGLPILGYRGDFRLSADNEGLVVNLQVEYFINNSGGRIVTSLQDLERCLSEVFIQK